MALIGAADVNTALLGNMAATAAVRSVVADWQSNQDLCHAAAAGKMAKVGTRETLDRKEVCQNATMLAPIVKHFGGLSQGSPLLQCE